MATYVIRVPDIGEGIAEVELVQWLVQPGDTVAEDQHLADVMTDKATVEVPSPVAGRVLQLGGAVGQVLAVGAELMRLEVAGPGNFKENSTPSHASQAQAATNSVAEKAAVQAPSAAPTAAPTPAPAVSAPTLLAARAPRQEGERPLASPAVRRRAQDLGIDLRYVPGSGPAGRILHEDV